MFFAVPGDSRLNESKKLYKYLDLVTKRKEKAVEHKSVSDIKHFLDP